MKKKTLVYVIGKYTGATARETMQNIKKAESVSLALIRAGYHVITPHKNTAGYEDYEDGNTITYNTWIELDINILSRCDAVYIMDNTKESKGSQIEIQYAKEHNIPEIKL